MSDRPHALYRFFDLNDRLLYVGITSNPAARFKQHRDDKPWWLDVANIRIEPFDDRPSVLEAERQAIELEHPIYNVTHNRGSRRSAQRPIMECQFCKAGIRDRGYVAGIDPFVVTCDDCLHGERSLTIHLITSPWCDEFHHDAWDHGVVVRGNDADLRDHLLAMRMPDDCHDHCGPEGIDGLYFPYRWEDGLAMYMCRAKHTWTCGWPSYSRGRQLLNRGLDFSRVQGSLRSMNLHLTPEMIPTTELANGLTP